MKYRLTKVIDKHYPRHDYTNFQLVEEDGVTEIENGYNPKKKRHPLGRMKFHANYDISREFRKYTNTDLFVPAPKSLIEKLRVQAAKEAAPAPEKEDEEEDVLCLDNPVNTDNFVASQQIPGGAEKAADSEKIAERTGTTAIHKPEEFDDFFGHGPEDHCVEVAPAKVEPSCQRVESSNSDTSDEETTLVPEQGCSPKAACAEVQEGTAESVTSAVCPGSENTDAAKKDEKLCKPATASASPVETNKAEKGNTPTSSGEPPVMTNTEATTVAVELKNPGVPTSGLEVKIDKEPKPTEAVSAANTGTPEANTDTEKMTEMNSSSSQEKKIVTQTDSKAESGKETESQTVLQAEEKTDKQTDSGPQKQEVKRVEHTVSLPMAEKDSSTEDETSAVKMSSDTESVKSIIRQASVDKSGDKSPEKSVKFSKLK